ncbi:PREDICTED: protein FAM24A-like [Propithecus coquereli]|uniref:Protein FAM24A n=1 Tax=Propithecus coquereli TaxID=379532 RepID=A0A2K6EM47_PROCO|nr:PREDICTED: protein FAM24A-like [Propithecus coquereli]
MVYTHRICLGFILSPLQEISEVVKGCVGRKATFSLTALLCLGVSKMFDVRTKIMIGIGSSLLIATIVLTSIVLCLYIKVSKALRAAKEPDIIAIKGNSLAKLCWVKNAHVRPTATESYPVLQCCDGCQMYADFDSLPPCCCDINEGL